MRMTVSFAAMTAACGLLSACGGASAGGNANAPTPADAAGGGGDALVGGWTEADACKTLDQGVVAAVAGQAVTKAETKMNHQADGDDPVSRSQCHYLLADGRTVILSTRVEMPVDNTDGPAKFEAQEKSMNMVPEAVAGVGRGAYWTPGDMPHLDFWLGKHQTAFFQFKGDASTITLKKGDEAWAKDLAIKLSHKIGG
ncbi:hypothetical protein [Sphingomonas bacterium]|uniref:hypothetical protein n=1 Tax=Sphingomonas bacterium TaxID=1895847 RepID=UPI00262308CF|nr:hypothetical protein [Sphingomonas bacterium]MDB5679915.1 hypothetical protein [Sphingomonas bacterium]